MSDDIQVNLSKELIKEKRSDRLWRNIRTLAWLIIVIAYAVLLFGPTGMSHTPSGPYVSLVRMTGTIMPSRPFSMYSMNPALKKAFKDPKAKGVILLINSPGGAATQASMIHDRIEQLKKQYHKKVVVVGEDALASGAYLISSAADKIYVNRDTLTGSIGVILSGFGFVDAMHKIGVSRRLYTAGTNKDRLDPFEPVRPQDVSKINTLLTQVHQNFIQDVINGRGKRLKGNRKELFSGDFWTGETAVKLGLADGTADVWTVMRKEFGVKHAIDYSPRPSLFASIFKGIGSELKLGLTENNSPLKAQAY